MAAHTGRNDFTSADDNLLMQYIAKYRPEPAGRLGNALYKTLVENAERKWSWSRRHTWQSWRERYKKHQAEFDRRILKHQQKLAEKGQAKYAEEEQAEMGLKRKARDEPQASTHEKKRQKTGTLAQSNGGIGGAVNKECPAKEKPKEKSQAPPPQSKGQDADNEGQQNQAIPGDFPEEPMPDENNAPADQNPVASIYPDLNTAPSPGLSRPADPPPSGFSTSTPRPNGNAPTPPDSATKKPTSEVPKAADPVPAKPSQAPKPKPKKRRSSIHEDPFVSGSSSDHDNAPPPPLQRPSVRRQPPVYKEGAFRTTIQQSRPWPPVRKHHHSRPKPSNVQEPREQEQQTEVPPPPKDRVVQEQPHPPPPAPARRSSGNVVTSEASSSKVKLPPGHYHSREEVLDAVELPPNGAAGGTTEPHQPVNSELLNAPPKENFLAAPAPPATIHRTRLDDDPPRSISDSLRRRRPAAPSKPAESRVESVVITGASVTLVNDSGELDDRPIQLDDVFSDVRPPPRSPLVYTMQAPPPRIDLHKTLAMQRLRKRTRTRTRSSASSNSNKAPSVLSRTSSRASIAKGKAVVAPHKTATTCTTTPASPHSDAQLLQMAGRQVLLALAKRYGVTEDTVFKAYKRLKDLEKLNEYLAELQKQTEAAGEALMNSMIAEEGGEGEEGGGGEGQGQGTME
ncbi:hypothetical protein CC2G_006393 [Coprinopsis cinerea AmutBmut pab1-1]|nr:hypothetical protein CC2G_006393 [Coprinopsis cinerea AmutBmut pab1-1]